MQINNFFKLVVSIALPLFAGFIGSSFTSTSIQSGWYAELAKPALNPPSWIFAPVWTTLYVLMGISFFLIWKNYSLIRANKRIVRIWKIGIVVFFIQLFLNALWSIIFFGLQSPGWALVNIAALWLAIIWTIAVFYKIFRPAAYLLLPYILWVSFAMYLNYTIFILN